MKKIFLISLVLLSSTLTFGQFSYTTSNPQLDEKQKVWSYNIKLNKSNFLEMYDEYLYYIPGKQMYLYLLEAPIKHNNETKNIQENYIYDEKKGKYMWDYKTTNIEIWFKSKQEVLNFIENGNQILKNTSADNIKYKNGNTTFELEKRDGLLYFKTKYDINHFIDGNFNLCYFSNTISLKLNKFP
jgi:uncharacterized protein YegP (UPF0339 family)